MVGVSLLKMDKSKTYKSWEKFLDPEKLKTNLILGSIYLTAYETLKNSVIDHVKGIYQFSIPSTPDEKLKYKEKVLNYCPKDEFHACCLWFFREGAIHDDDINKIKNIRKHRNEIAHELPKFIANIEYDINRTRIQDIYIITRKIDTWWIRNIDPPLDENLDEIDLEHVPDHEIISGNSILLELIYSVIDNEEYLKYIQKKMKKRENR